MARTQTIRIDRFRSQGLDMSAAIEAFTSYCQAKNLSPNTLVYYRYRLDSFHRYLKTNASSTLPEDVTTQTIRSFIVYETQNNSPSTANHSIITLRAFFNYLVKDGLIGTCPTTGVEKVKRRASIIDTFSIEQIETILGTCKQNFVGIRDRAIILTLVDCGLRASELCGLAMDDVSWNDQTLQVLGKGDKERLVPFGRTNKVALAQYQARRGELQTNALFVTCYGEPINRYRLRLLVKDRCKKAGIMGVRCSPHTFRHTFAVMYLRAGGDLFSLQKLLGHSDLSMTRKYCELSQMDVVDRHRLYSPADRIQSASVNSKRQRIK